MSEQGGGQPSVELRVQELEEYCDGDELTLEGLQEKIAGIPADAVRGSIFFHWACQNEGVTLGMIEYLLDAFPEAAQSIVAGGWSPLHYACGNKRMDPGIILLLLDRWPGAVNHQDNKGNLPLHRLCRRGRGDDKADALAILKLLLAAAPLSATIADSRRGDLPIHLAGLSGKPFPFCKRLIDAHPETLMVQDSDGMLPIHDACYGGDIETVQYMLELYPESIDARGGGDDVPIHYAASRRIERGKVDIIKCLLEKDPDSASKTDDDQCLPFHLACQTQDSLESVRLLFDAYPEAINIETGGGKTPLDVAKEEGDGELVEFLQTQLAYARQAEDSRAMTTPDGNGWLPLHRALRNGACLGAIKLLIAGNRDALQVSFNQSGAFPLHIACEFSTVEVVQHLLGISDNHLHALDSQSNSTLHYACHGGNLGVVKCLLERGVPSVSEPNSQGKLPIHLLWDSDRVDRNSVEYVDAVWSLLLAHPETVTHCRGTRDAPSHNKRQRLG